MATFGDMFSYLTLSILVSGCPLVGHAQTRPLSDYKDCGYVTAQDLTEANKKLVEAEGGVFTEVPMDYNDPARGTTKIYSYFSGGYDPKKQTFVLFTGGPGQNSHLQISSKFAFYELPGYNFLIFDQRGIALSRFATEEQARDARNMSSEATAKDVVTILDKLNIKKISVYGASYGTVPATIFASLFPERTQSLVLEGVVYTGWDGVMMDQHNEVIVQKYYDTLSEEIKIRLDELIAAKKFTSFWFPMMVKGFMTQYGSSRFAIFKQALHETLLVRKLDTEQSVRQVFNELAKTQDPVNITKQGQERALHWYNIRENTNACRTISDSTDLNQLLMLKEFDAGLSHVTALSMLKDRKIVPFPGSNYAHAESTFTNMTEKISYNAANYPVKVPTFYIQGTMDGATPAPGATLHYKNAAQGPAQILLFKGSSHMPFGLIIQDMNNAEENWQDLQAAFTSFLNGEPLTCETKTALEQKYKNINLAIATKGFKTNPKCNGN